MSDDRRLAGGTGCGDHLRRQSALSLNPRHGDPV